MTQPPDKRPGSTEEDAIRGAMSALRAHDERRAPPFDPMWRAAETKARAKPSRVWMLPASAGGLAAAAALVLVVSASMRSPDAAAPSSAGSPAPVGSASMPAASVAVSGPTLARSAPPALALDFLLRPPASPSFVSLTSFDRDPLVIGTLGPAR